MLFAPILFLLGALCCILGRSSLHIRLSLVFSETLPVVDLAIASTAEKHRTVSALQLGRIIAAITFVISLIIVVLDKIE